MHKKQNTIHAVYTFSTFLFILCRSSLSAHQSSWLPLYFLPSILPSNTFLSNPSPFIKISIQSSQCRCRFLIEETCLVYICISNINLHWTYLNTSVVVLRTTWLQFKFCRAIQGPVDVLDFTENVAHYDKCVNTENTPNNSTISTQRHRRFCNISDSD